MNVDDLRKKLEGSMKAAIEKGWMIMGTYLISYNENAPIRQKTCCAIGAVLVEEDRVEDRKWGYRRAAKTMGLSEEAADVFTSGFDGIRYSSAGLKEEEIPFFDLGRELALKWKGAGPKRPFPREPGPPPIPGEST